MDAQRRAEVLEGLYREIRREHEQVAGQRLDTVKEQAQAVHDSIQALKVGGAKPSESSMVQRIETQRNAMVAIRAIAIQGRRVGATGHDMSDALMRIADAVTAIVDGPPDPERDRESLAELAEGPSDDQMRDK